MSPAGPSVPLEFEPTPGGLLIIQCGRYRRNTKLGQIIAGFKRDIPGDFKAWVLETDETEIQQKVSDYLTDAGLVLQKAADAGLILQKVTDAGLIPV